MLFSSGGSAANPASNMFRQIKTSIDKDQDGSVSRQELIEARQAVSAGLLPNGASSLIDQLLIDYESYIDPNSSGGGITEGSFDSQLAKITEEQEKKAREEAEAKAEELKAEHERQEKTRAEMERAKIQAGDKEAINREARAMSLFKMAFKQLTGEDASAEDILKWQKAVQNPTTNLDKARADVLAVRPEMRERLNSNGMTDEVIQQRRDAIAQAGAQLDIGSAALARLQDDYAHMPGSIQSITSDFLNAFA